MQNLIGTLIVMLLAIPGWTKPAKRAPRSTGALTSVAYTIEGALSEKMMRPPESPTFYGVTIVNNSKIEFNLLNVQPAHSPTFLSLFETHDENTHPAVQLECKRYLTPNLRNYSISVTDSETKPPWIDCLVKNVVWKRN
ncbi:MAG: hypothetical protein HYZ71_13340 [Deltaproteobacteria bacterium]|nr:hypothetical protein [Deltaproteobacteria bacterium]